MSAAAETTTAPEAKDYRMDPVDIDPHTCHARKILPTNADYRWSIAIYKEAQCGKEITDEASMCCKKCAEKLERYTVAPSSKIGWCGTVYEEPLSWQHMLGTAWATFNLETRKLRWLGGAVKTE